MRNSQTPPKSEPKTAQNATKPQAQEKAAVDGQKAVAQPSLDTNKNEGRRQWSRKDLNTI